MISNIKQWYKNNICNIKISAFLDHHLKEMIPVSLCILEDTWDFFCCLQNLGILEIAVSVSFEAIDLYSFLPYKVYFVLNESSFEWDKKLYHQTFLTTIGANFESLYSNILAGLEKNIFNSTQYNYFFWVKHLIDSIVLG